MTTPIASGDLERELAEIRKRREEDPFFYRWIDHEWCVQDRRTLLRIVDDLRAELATRQMMFTEAEMLESLSILSEMNSRLRAELATATAKLQGERGEAYQIANDLEGHMSGIVAEAERRGWEAAIEALAGRDNVFDQNAGAWLESLPGPVQPPRNGRSEGRGGDVSLIPLRDQYEETLRDNHRLKCELATAKAERDLARAFTKRMVRYYDSSVDLEDDEFRAAIVAIVDWDGDMSDRAYRSCVEKWSKDAERRGWEACREAHRALVYDLRVEYALNRNALAAFGELEQRAAKLQPPATGAAPPEAEGDDEEAFQRANEALKILCPMQEYVYPPAIQVELDKIAERKKRGKR